MTLIVAAPESGAGKTTITAGLVRAFRRQGLRVQPFKAGPDYLDPGYLTQAAGRSCRNLDTWMVPSPALRELYQRACMTADVAIVEGMMGLFDGRGAGEEGSTAQLAKLLEAPVVVIIDVQKTSRSAGAIALGCQRFDPRVPLKGFLLNGVGGAAHRQWVTDAIVAATGLPVYGALAHHDDLALPERHLGLVPTAERPVSDDFFDRLADEVEQSFDLPALLALARAAGPAQPKASGLFPAELRRPSVTIGLADDEAFSFYYADTLDLLRAWGAHLVPFSPLHDHELPAGIDALYLGGGFPELYAAELAANEPLIGAIRRAARADLPIYAECGGLIYISRGIVDREQRRFPLVGLVPVWSTIGQPRLTLGYREVIAHRDLPLLRRGQNARGHEFHWSVLETPLPAEAAAYDLVGAPVPREGYAQGNLLASYCHIQFGSNPALAPNLIATAAQWQQTRAR